MSYKRLFYTLGIILLLANTSRVLAQTPAYFQAAPDLAHRLQLAGLYDSSSSLMVNSIQLPLEVYDKVAPVKHLQTPVSKGTVLTWLPVSLIQQTNSNHPYEWNIAPMIPAKGYQALFSAGVHAAIGKHISVQLNPQLVYAHNAPYENSPDNFVPREWNDYMHWPNTIDMPEHYGKKNYTAFFPGQSYIRYDAGKISVGISTEQMWWGPGTYNALVLSNNAPGFLHATINTIKPIHTGIGSFEGQIIGGKLENTSYPPAGQYNVFNGQFLYQAKNDQWRYLTGMIFSWQPKWVPHLYLGIIKASQLYHSDIHSPLDILPFQGFFGKTVTRSEKDGQKASLGSLFMRYLLPKEKAEFYVEYGRGDRSLMPWSLASGHNYPRAYVGGFRKLFDLHRDAHIQAVIELAQLQLPTGLLTEEKNSWYTHDYVRQGYTQQGRVLGAGIGPGSNSQTLEVSWMKGNKKIGMRLERLAHNYDLYYNVFEYIQDYTRKWIDLSTSFNAEWDVQNLVLSANLGITRSLNYQWQTLRTDGNDTFKRGYDLINIGARIGVAYRF